MRKMKNTKKAYAKASAPRRIRRFLPHNAMIKLYKAFILLPHLEYCSPSFLGIGTGQRNRLEDGNCYILRSLIGHNKSISYDELLTTASMTSSGADLGGGCRGCAPPPPEVKLSSIYIRTRF